MRYTHLVLWDVRVPCTVGFVCPLGTKYCEVHIPYTGYVYSTVGYVCLVGTYLVLLDMCTLYCVPCTVVYMYFTV